MDERNLLGGEYVGALTRLMPYRLASAVIKCAAQNHAPIDEVRLRLGRPMYITSCARDIRSSYTVTREDIEHTVMQLTSGSLYSHAETIREGYIISRDGIRAGICGRAAVRDGELCAVSDISSLSLRFPRRVEGAADSVYSLMRSRGFRDGVLIYSRPGVGKTTVLRELAHLLASGRNALRVAIVDTRCELSACCAELETADVLMSYPRGAGIEIAVRTLSPRYIICDEIGSAADALAISEGARAGVCFAASAHAGSFDELMRSEYIRRLWETGVFGLAVGLLSRRESGGYESEISYFISESESSREALAESCKA